MGDHSGTHFTGPQSVLSPERLAQLQANYAHNKAAFDHFRQDVHQDRELLNMALNPGATAAMTAKAEALAVQVRAEHAYDAGRQTVERGIHAVEHTAGQAYDTLTHPEQWFQHSGPAASIPPTSTHADTSSSSSASSSSSSAASTPSQAMDKHTRMQDDLVAQQHQQRMQQAQQHAPQRAQAHTPTLAPTFNHTTPATDAHGRSQRYTLHWPAERAVPGEAGAAPSQLRAQQGRFRSFPSGCPSGPRATEYGPESWRDCRHDGEGGSTGGAGACRTCLRCRSSNRGAGHPCGGTHRRASLRHAHPS